MGAVKAVLCSYPFPDRAKNEEYPLGVTRETTTNVDEITTYLNGLSLTQEPNGVCNGLGRTEHIIVLEYKDRPPATVYARACGIDQSGQIRYGYSLEELTGFWGVGWND